MFFYLLIIDINNCLFWFCKIVILRLFHCHNYSNWPCTESNSKLPHVFPLLNDFAHGLFASIYHAQLIAGSFMSNKKSVIKKICGLLLSRSWLARLARIWKGLLGIDRFNYSGCISVIVTARTVQNFIDEYHFTYRHVFVCRIELLLNNLIISVISKFCQQ